MPLKALLLTAPSKAVDYLQQHPCLLQDWMRNNRGINDGSDLPEDYMSKLYESIVFNEIKMKVRSAA